MMGSASIICEVVRDKKKRGKVYHRIMFAMSLMDLNTSFWYFLSTWPIPRGTEDVAYASGTTQSCTAQGFFLQLGLATPLYNVVLSIYYCFVVRYQWKERQFNVAEKLFHALPFTFALATALTGIGLDLFNNANLVRVIVAP